MTKLETCETEFIFNLAGKTGNHFIDIGQVLCLANRKGDFRQGLQYVFKLELFGDVDTASYLEFATLPNSWPAVNSWEKLFHAWRDQQDEAAREAGLESTKARYRDFKIHYSADHVSSGMAANLIPMGYTIASPTGSSSYEWLPSQVVIPNDGAPGTTGERYLHMLGTDVGTTSGGMILAYAQSRSRPHVEDPNIVTGVDGGLLADMIDVGDNIPEVVTNMQEHNNTPPYLIENDNVHEGYPGAVNQSATYASFVRDILSVRAGGSSVSSDASAFHVANCGLIQLIINNASLLKLTVMTGEYSGVMARPMQEVN